MDVKDIGVIVTGAASGMGRATATLLVKEGANVMLLDINETGVKQTARDLGATAVVADLADPVSIERAVQQATESVGPIRITVCCGAVGRLEPFIGPEAVPFEQLADTININLIGNLKLAHLVANDLLEHEPLDNGERGLMIFVASGAAFDGPLAAAAYTAAKGGIVSMTLALARELGDAGIRVNTISPGGFNTAMLSDLPEEMLAVIPMTTPFPKRLGEPEEFAALVQHICQNTYLNGSVIRLDAAHRMAYQSQTESHR